MREKIKKIILDTLFPINCLICKKDDEWLCEKCLKKIEILENQVCPYCEKVDTPGGTACQSCRMDFRGKNESAPLNSLVVSSKYGQLSKFIHAFKYNFIRDLSEPLGEIAAKAFLRNELAIPDIIVPIPLHPRRLRWRGFNQSQLLADFLAENIAPGLPIEVAPDLILRKKYTTPQKEIHKYAERKKNLLNAFSVNSGLIHKISGKHILIMDDVCTTGATILECAKILKRHGAKKVTGLVLARQDMK